MTLRFQKPDYHRIAVLELAIWGRIYTAESKAFRPALAAPNGSWLTESDETKTNRALAMDALLDEYEVQ